MVDLYQIIGECNKYLRFEIYCMGSPSQ